MTGTFDQHQRRHETDILSRVVRHRGKQVALYLQDGSDHICWFCFTTTLSVLLQEPLLLQSLFPADHRQIQLVRQLLFSTMIN